MANVRKLMRLAREFEADEGRDLRGFLDYVAERDVIPAREGEAPLEAEALDAVRLMTIHRAKGLEFPVVCVADLGKDGREDDGRCGSRTTAASACGSPRSAGGAVDCTKLAGIKARGRSARPRRRSGASSTWRPRAPQDHLVLSGATDLGSDRTRRS